MKVKKTKDHFTIEMEAYEYDNLIKAVDFGAAWMDENGYREEQRRYENLRDDLSRIIILKTDETANTIHAHTPRKRV